MEAGTSLQNRSMNNDSHNVDNNRLRPKISTDMQVEKEFPHRYYITPISKESSDQFLRNPLTFGIAVKSSVFSEAIMKPPECNQIRGTIVICTKNLIGDINNVKIGTWKVHCKLLNNLTKSYGVIGPIGTDENIEALKTDLNDSGYSITNVSRLNKKESGLIVPSQCIKIGFTTPDLPAKLYHEDEEEDKTNKKLEQNYNKPTIKSDEIAIPRNSVGAVIGRHGLKIKYIENLTRTTVIFQDKNDDKPDVSCIIRGTSDKVKEARKLIFQSIEEVPVLEYLEMSIPNFAVARVFKMIGFGGRNLSESIGANVYSENRPNHTENRIIHMDSGSTRKIMIKGTHAQIKAAELAVKNIVEKEIEIRKQVNSSVVNISHRNMVKSHVKESISIGSSLLLQNDDKQMEDSKFIEGIVSAFESPCHFWFQMKGPSIIKLDSLVEDMTAYYNEGVNRGIHMKVDVNYEDIVAAKFPHDKKWYRGCICKHEETDDPEKHVVYFVDFGDTDEVDQENICELRTDFLQLKFQAVETYLANIDPKSITPEAVDVFTELVYVNLYDSVKIRIIGYNTDTKIGIPYTQVISTNGEMEIDIAEEMVKRGFAKRML